jgi:hypothetical protein
MNPRPPRPLSPVQEILARGGDSRLDGRRHEEPDACLRICVDETGRWSAILWGPVFDRTPADALSVCLADSVRLLASAAASVRRPLVVHTSDEHGSRYVDVFDQPRLDFHQIPAAAVDAAANADAVRAGLPPAVWTPDRVTWTPTLQLTGPRRLPRSTVKVAAAALVVVAMAATLGLVFAAPGRAHLELPAPSTRHMDDPQATMLEEGRS